MKYQNLSSTKNSKKNKIEYHLLQKLFGALKVELEILTSKRQYLEAPQHLFGVSDSRTSLNP